MIQLNAERNGQWPGCIHDNDNPDNISLKNPDYCELTALYAMWKNSKSDIQGLYHYRRYLMSSVYSASFSPAENRCIVPGELKSMCVTAGEIAEALRENDIILSMPTLRSPLDSLEALACWGRKYVYFNVMRKVIRDYWPDYLPSLNKVFDSCFMSVCNMFIAGRKVTDEYCTWLFDVLGKVESLISQDKGTESYARLYGYLSELLLNVFVLKNNLKAKYFMMLYSDGYFSCNGVVNRIKKAAKKIPFLLSAVRAVRNFRIRLKQGHFQEGRETEKFAIRITTLTGLGIFRSVFIAELIPKTDDIFPAVEKVITELRAEAKSCGMLFVPRVIIANPIDDQLYEALWDIGVRIIKH